MLTIEILDAMVHLDLFETYQVSQHGCPQGSKGKNKKNKK